MRPRGVSTVIVVKACRSHDEGRHRACMVQRATAGRGTFHGKTAQNPAWRDTACCPEPYTNRGVVRLGRVLHSVIDKVYNWNNLKSASKHVVANHGAGGIDRMNTEQWEAGKDIYLAQLRKALMDDAYRSKPRASGLYSEAGEQEEAGFGDTDGSRSGMPAGRAEHLDAGI